MRRAGLGAVLGALALVGALAGCGTAASVSGAKPNVTKPPVVDVVFGGIESSEVSSRSAVRSAWPKLLYRSVLGTAGQLYDFAQPGQTVAGALAEDRAVGARLHPDLVTIWISTADLLNGTPLAAYRLALDALVASVGKSGATVLIANVPSFERLPFYQACLLDPSLCGASRRTVPSPAALQRAIAGYNAVIASVASAHKARVVDVAAVLAHTSGLSGASISVLSAAEESAVERAFAADIPKRLRRR
ncbi:MAG: hypothetical protein JWM85_1712 [Acidimicrobiaceae bacterium]|nr:hypothetical protein [Acidimicrobiaceae bacterium]